MVKFRVQATEEEVALIKKAARKRGLSVSGFVREIFARGPLGKGKSSQSVAVILDRKTQPKTSLGQRAP